MERLGDHTYRQNALLLGGAGNDRGRTRTRATAHASGNEGHMRACKMIENFRHGFFGCGCTNLWLGTCTQTLRQGRAHLYPALGGILQQGLCVGICHNKFDAFQSAFDHVVDRIATGATDAENRDTGLQFRKVGNGKFKAHVAQSSADKGWL